MKTTRPYAQTERRAATERTRTAILDAGIELSREKLSIEILLSDVAERAGVTVQTVLRHFGSREGLFDALHAYGTERVSSERQAPVGDVTTGIRVLVDHYETAGDMSLSFLAQERTDERVRAITTAGKALHREWVSTVLGPLVGDNPAALDELVVVTDVYAWKLLRRDRALSREDTERRMLSLTRAVIEHHRPASTRTPA
jgi:AcrR family transcriptional regulator